MHHNHDRNFIYEKRGFANVTEHNDILIKRWNNKVDNNSVVFHLGDITFSKDAQKNLEILFDVLNYKILYILPGNHTSGYRQIFDKALSINQIDKYYRLLYDRSVTIKMIYLIPNYYEIFVNGKPIVLCHYPMKCWNGHAQGSIILVGHTHGSYHDSLPMTLDKGKILDVGPESVKEPLDFDEVMAIMDRKTVLTESHHNAKTQNPFS